RQDHRRGPAGNEQTGGGPAAQVGGRPAEAPGTHGRQRRGRRKAQGAFGKGHGGIEKDLGGSEIEIRLTPGSEETWRSVGKTPMANGWEVRHEKMGIGGLFGGAVTHHGLTEY